MCELYKTKTIVIINVSLSGKHQHGASSMIHALAEREEVCTLLAQFGNETAEAGFHAFRGLIFDLKVTHNSFLLYLYIKLIV